MLARSWVTFWLIVLVGSQAAFSQAAPPLDAENNSQHCMKVGIFSDFGPTSTDIIVPLLHRMYELADLCLIPVMVSANRSAALLLSGQLDAEMVRATPAIADTNGRVIMVPQPMFITNLQFAWIEGSKFNGTPQDLPGRTVGILSGQSAARSRIAKLTDNLTLLPNLKSAAELLARGRIDVLVSDGVDQDVLEEDLRAFNKRLETKVFLQAPVYHVVHVRHADKTKKLAEALKTMIKTGAFSNLGEKHGLHTPAIQP